MKTISFDRCNLYESETEPTCAHNGIGLISFKRLITRGMVAGNCHFMDFTVMPPGTSVGRHTHAPNEEEYYLILEGSGQMERDGERFDVKAGDLLRNQPGGTHSLANTGACPLKMFVFELGVTQ